MKIDIDDQGIDQMLLQLDNLRIMAAVLECGRVTAAAASLNKSPSAIVRGIAELERSLGLKLLERHRGSVSMTPHGEALFMRVRRIAAESNAVVAELGRLPGTSVAALRHLLQNGRKLLLLIHLADAGTISGAAAMLAITQPGASLALSRIEESIGIALFYRNLQGVFPTDPAARLILRAKRIRAELRHALSDLAAVTGAPSGTIVVGTLPMARADMLPRAVGACLDVWPQLRVQIVEAQREALLAKLRSGEIDAVLSAHGPSFDPRGLISEPISRDRLIVVSSRTHVLAGAGMADLRTLAAAKWILPWENAVSRALFDSQFDQRGIEPPVPVVETGDLLVMRPLLARGDMLAFTSWSLVRFEIDAGLLVEIDTAMDELAREIVLLRREGADLPASALALIDELMKAAAAH
jgi:LysR family transcriptional regulator of gallate degradation